MAAETVSKQRRLSLGWWFAGLAALPLLTFGMVAFLAWRTAADMEESAEQRLVSSASMMAVQAKELVSTTRGRIEAFLHGRSARSVVTGTAPANPGEESPGLLGIVLVFDETGQLRSAPGSQLTYVDISGRDYFRQAQAGSKWAVSGLLQQSAFGEPVFAVARRLDEHGAFAGIAVIYVAADRIAAPASLVGLGEGGALTLYRTDGVVVASYPGGAQGSAASLDPQLGATLPGSSGIVPTSDRSRMTGFAKVEDPPLIAMASFPRGPLERAAWTRIGTTLLAVSPVALVLLIVCTLMMIAVVRQKRHHEALDAAARQNETLLQEIHHRIKNNLAMVTAMVRIQSISEGEKQTLVSRIQAMMAVHQLMYESNFFAMVDAQTYIAKLLDGLQAGQRPDVRIDQSVEAVQLTADQVQPVGLIVSEAVTNAYKHAFPESRAGTISVELRKMGDGAELAISDDGVGAPVTASTGMGTRLMRNLARQLGGELRMGAERGSRLVVTFPLVKS